MTEDSESEPEARVQRYTQSILSGKWGDHLEMDCLNGHVAADSQGREPEQRDKLNLPDALVVSKRRDACREGCALVRSTIAKTIFRFQRLVVT